MNTSPPLLERLQDEAGLCRNDGANDIAALLDEACAALSYYEACAHRKQPPHVPSEVRLHATVRGDFPSHTTVAAAGLHPCESNRWGALSVLAQDGKRLGIKPGEFVVTQWRTKTTHENSQ